MAAKIFVLVFSRKFRKIFRQFREIFVKHEIEICAKFLRNSKEISRKTKQKITLTSFFLIHGQILLENVIFLKTQNEIYVLYV